MSRLADIAPAAFEGIDKQFLLKPFDGILECLRLLGPCFLGRLKCGGEVITVDHLIIAEENGSLDTVLQFPDIAGPVILGQGVDGGGRNPLYALPVFLGVFLEKIVREKKQVGLPISKRRKVNG